MDKKYITVVFEYEQGTKLLQALTTAFSSDSRIYIDAKITAVSMEDEITRCEQLETEIVDRLN